MILVKQFGTLISATCVALLFSEPIAGSFGYHITPVHHHRNFLQRLTGTGRRHDYVLTPNLGMGGMNGRMTTMTTTSRMMPGMGMGMGMGMGYGMNQQMFNAARSSSSLSHACRSNDTNTLRQVNCPYMNPQDLHYCITRADEPFLNALVRKCKGVFTSNAYQMAAYGVELIVANKAMPFGSIITRNTCAMLGVYELELLIKTAILSRTQNSYAYVDYLISTCQIPAFVMSRMQTVALMTGDMPVAMRLQRASMFPVNKNYVQNIVYSPSGRIFNLVSDSALSNLTGRDMAMLGKIGRTCALLRAEHITHPLFNSELLSEMNENCFSHLNPNLFWYMNSDMIKRFRWWRSATPAQIRMIPIGKPIQAVPFFLLGSHYYINRLDRYHPCSGITSSQRISIQMEPKTARAFFERCRASNAVAIKISASVLISALLAYFVFVA